jgi:ribosomal-protein-alanine N-acetyltransferase
MTVTADEIFTKRLRLRRARPSDIVAMHHLLSDAAAMRYWDTPPHRSLQETEHWMEKMLNTPQAESEDFIVEMNGQVVGKAGCYRAPFIGFIFHPDHWGKGIAQEALRPIITRIFSRLMIPALEADVDPRNLASLAVLKKLGFNETGRAEKNILIGETWCDSVYLSLERNRHMMPDNPS